MSVDLQDVFLRIYPDKILSEKCHDIDPNDPDLPAVLDKMIAIMMAQDGVGLAAPQVGLPWNVFIVHLGDEEPRALVNPKIESYGEKTCLSKEGCLSLPGVAGKLDCRHEQITVSTCMPKSNDRMTIALEGAEAIIFQHEYDHLQGLTLFDKMKPVQKMMSKKKYLKSKKKYEKLQSDFVKLRLKKEQLEKIVKTVEEAKQNGEQSSEPQGLSTDGPDGNDLSTSVTTASASESST